MTEQQARRKLKSMGYGLTKRLVPCSMGGYCKEERYSIVDAILL